MRKPKMLRVGDRVTVVSLSGGMLGEPFCRHELELGTRRLKTFGLQTFYGHAAPRIALPYGAKARVDAKRQLIEFLE